MYYVYYGHLTADTDSEFATHELKCFGTKDGVLNFYEIWMNPDNHGSHEECSECYFNVIEGKELFLKPKEKVIEYELEEK